MASCRSNVAPQNCTVLQQPRLEHCLTHLCAGARDSDFQCSMALLAGVHEMLPMAGTEALKLGALLVIGTLLQCTSSWLLGPSCQCMV